MATLSIPQRWQDERHHFASRGRPIVAGISGGRTSGMMAALLPDDASLLFQNTGKEHPGTYDFLERLDDALGGRIVWMEYRPPVEYGAPPAQAGFEVVTAQTANRTGEPFKMMMQALADYRKLHKGLGPVAPWARGRLCTAYMKQRVSQHYLEARGLHAYDMCVGLRADEPARVGKFLADGTRRVRHRCPLSDAGITKPDVLEFFQQQSFNLNIADWQGNCTACFLKDEGDLARVLNEPETDLAWWQEMVDTYDNFGGRRFRGYAALAAEGPGRLDIEADLRAGVEPRRHPAIHADRHRLVVIQERKRLAGKAAPFSCACEGAATLAGMDEDEEQQYLLNFAGGE